MIVPVICQRVAFFALRAKNTGAIAQLGERVLCKHEVVGSIPSGSTIILALPAIAYLGACLSSILRICGQTGKAPPGYGCSLDG